MICFSSILTSDLDLSWTLLKTFVASMISPLGAIVGTFAAERYQQLLQRHLRIDSHDACIFLTISGQIILGGGLVKHHTCNANLMRNGADFSVFVNTGHEFDGSDSGASPDEAISWGKIRITAQPVKVSCKSMKTTPLCDVYFVSVLVTDPNPLYRRSDDCLSADC